jgi:hypothetical protein
MEVDHKHIYTNTKQFLCQYLGTWQRCETYRQPSNLKVVGFFISENGAQKCYGYPTHPVKYVEVSEKTQGS